MKVAIVVLAALVLVFVYRLRSLAVASRTMAPPSGPGPDGKLARCPSPMRCVSSDEDGEAHVEPLAVAGSADERRARVLAAIAGTGGVVRTDRADYVHAEYRTALWGFVDDVEVRFTPSSVAIRSASRVGKSDLGANRKRVEAIRAALGAP